MVRVKKRWNQQTSRSIAQMANAIASTVWKLAAEMVLNLENENFETDTQAQRMNIMEEAVCFLVHICDRWLYTRAGEQERAEFVSTLVRDLARMLEDSRIDVQGAGAYQAEFIDKLNLRSSAYSRFGFDPIDGAGFALRCRLGDLVAAAMGARDQRWIPDYVVGREAPEMEAALQGSLNGLVVFSDQAAG